MAAVAHYFNDEEENMPVATGGFTDEDRRTLTELSVKFGYLADAVKQSFLRIESLENARISSRDVQLLMTEIDELKMEKKDTASALAIERRETCLRIDSVEKRLEERINSLDQWRWQIVGGAIASSALIGFILKFIKF